MTPSDPLRAALATAAAVGVTLYLRGDEVRLRGNLRALPAAVRDTLRAERDTLRRVLAETPPPPTPALPTDPADADIAAVRLTSPLIGHYWLVADDNEMTPDILAAGLPVFRFREVPYLRGLAAADLTAVAAVKRVFPTSEVIQ